MRPTHVVLTVWDLGMATATWLLLKLASAAVVLVNRKRPKARWPKIYGEAKKSGSERCVFGL